MNASKRIFLQSGIFVSFSASLSGNKSDRIYPFSVFLNCKVKMRFLTDLVLSGISHEADKAETSAAETEPFPTTMVRPLNGEVLNDFSAGELVELDKKMYAPKAIQKFVRKPSEN